MTQTNQNLSDIEIFWNQIKTKTEDARSWQDLTPNQQNAVIESVNILFGVLTGRIS
jgi:hypothetical protein